MIKVILIGPHQLIVEGLTILFKNESAFSIVSLVHNNESCLNQQLLNDASLIILDTQINADNGIELMEEIQKKYPATKTLILADQFNLKHVKKMLSYGVNSYLLKDTKSTNLFQVILKIIKGEDCHDNRLKNLLFQSYQPKKRKIASFNALTKEKRSREIHC